MAQDGSAIWVYVLLYTASSMKTTIDVSEPLLNEAKRRARAEGTTLRALVEEGLRRVLEVRASGDTFRLRDASVDGSGLQPEFRGAGWAAIREAAYDGRGE